MNYRSVLVATLAALSLSSCGDSKPGHINSHESQVNSFEKIYGPPATPTSIKSYAASRFLDHASFGPTPVDIQKVKTLGLNAWIDQQFALPASQIDGSFSENWDSNDTPGAAGRPYYELMQKNFLRFALSGEDQLRLRTTWALSQFIVVSELKVQSFAMTQYFNLLQNNSFGNFADLLRVIAKSPSMGVYLDNTQNKKEGICADCSVNENFARELMQLFTLGVMQLNPDGSPKRDANGKLLETYTQDDVQAMARALTGWDFLNPLPSSPPPLLRSGYRYPMVASWKEAHDSGEKKVLGQVIPAGGSAEQDLEKVIQILMNHPNLAPFISIRMIQHLVTSDPSPAYIKRIVAVFENNGNGVKGDMKALVRAILLDPEARAADDPIVVDHHFGKVREPVLFKTAMLRGMGCKELMANPDGGLDGVWNQAPFNAASVFSFFSPLYRAPGSNLLSPEQKLLTSSEFSARLGGISWIADQVPANIKLAGCNFDEFVTTYKKSRREFINLVSSRYFRGSMSPPQRDAAEKVMDRMTWGTSTTQTANVLQFMLSNPTFGVIK